MSELHRAGCSFYEFVHSPTFSEQIGPCTCGALKRNHDRLEAKLKIAGADHQQTIELLKMRNIQVEIAVEAIKDCKSAFQNQDNTPKVEWLTEVLKKVTLSRQVINNDL